MPPAGLGQRRIIWARCGADGSGNHDIITFMARHAGRGGGDRALDGCHPTALATRRSVRRQRHEGFNELPEAPPASPLKLFLSQFTSVIVWVLIGAAVVSGLLEDWLDAAAILAIVFLNGLLGFVQEYRAEQSLAALRKLSVATAHVLRDGSDPVYSSSRSGPRRSDCPGGRRPHSPRMRASCTRQILRPRNPHRPASRRRFKKT